MERLPVVIPSFEDHAAIRRCLTSLADATEIITPIVVDHGNRHHDPKLLEQVFPGVVHILAEPDLWWAGATNVGIRWALERGARSVMLLNDDCVLRREDIERLIVGDHEQHIVAPVQRDLRTEAVIAARAWTGIPLGFPTLYVERTVRSHRIQRTRLIIGGRGVVIPRSVFESIGLLDAERFPHYLSDHDLFLRCRAEGVVLNIEPGASVWVDQNRTSIAVNPETRSWNAFVGSLRSRRSHQGLGAQRAFYKSHYPVRSLWWLGLGLGLFRQTALWAVRRNLAIRRARR